METNPEKKPEEDLTENDVDQLHQYAERVRLSR